MAPKFRLLKDKTGLCPLLHVLEVVAHPGPDEVVSHETLSSTDPGMGMSGVTEKHRDCFGTKGCGTPVGMSHIAAHNEDKRGTGRSCSNELLSPSAYYRFTPEAFPLRCR